jgi:hypothetical protein
VYSISTAPSSTREGVPGAAGRASGRRRARLAPAHVGNGRTPQNAPRAGERVPTVEAWLVEAGFATLEHGRLVATELGRVVGSAIDDSLAAL